MSGGRIWAGLRCEHGSKKAFRKGEEAKKKKSPALDPWKGRVGGKSIKQEEGKLAIEGQETKKSQRYMAVLLK